MDSYWYLARSQLDVPSVGTGIFPAAYGGKIWTYQSETGNPAQTVYPLVGIVAVGGVPRGEPDSGVAVLGGHVLRRSGKLGSYYYYLTMPNHTISAVRDYIEEELGVPFLFIQAPSKLCAVDDQLPIPNMTNNNAEASWLLRRLKEDGVDYLDLRKSLHAEGVNHYAASYVRDIPAPDCPGLGNGGRWRF